MLLRPALESCALALLLGSAACHSIYTLDTALANCPPLGAVLPAPRAPSQHPVVQAVISQIEELADEASLLLGNGTALSLAAASVYEGAPLLQVAHAPPIYNTSGSRSVDADTVFRIGSVSKAFTVMGLFILSDKINMADPVTKYIPELGQLKADLDATDPIRSVEWEHVSLDALSSLSAGVEFGSQNDLAMFPSFNAAEYGLPELTDDEQPDCSAGLDSKPFAWEGSEMEPENFNYATNASSQDFWDSVGRSSATYPPYTTPAYSNMAYDLLGVVIERASGQSYAKFIQERILEPLDMSRTYVDKPANDSIGFISSEPNFWSTPIGSSASSGLYSTANDLLKFGKGILGYRLLSEVATKAWLKPRSHTSSLGISVGAPWEIGRSNSLTSDGRIIDIYSKNGGVVDYNCLFVLIPDYGIVMSMLTAGPASNVQTQLDLASMVLKPLVRAVEAAGKDEAVRLYSGTYTDGASKITLAVDDQSGLNVTSWVMDGKDILFSYRTLAALVPGGRVAPYASIRLYPTGLESKGKSSWRAVFSTTAPEDVSMADQLFIIQASCQTWSTLDSIRYGTRALDDFLFSLDGYSGKAVSISPRSFRRTLARVGSNRMGTGKED
ncbi:beta-lactamase [Thozetella sp. PMI_491]|nr:beta-lactamase [Thozetella sp. PMI_491]